MADKNMDGEWTYIHISSSIENFKEKLLKKTKLKEWYWGINEPTIFAGMYHIVDYVKVRSHRGKKAIFWCGGDILNLQTSPWVKLIAKVKADNVCENIVEQELLREMGIKARIHPAFFGSCEEFNLEEPTRNEAYISMHPGREEEYGLKIIERIAPKCPSINFHIFGISGIIRDNLIFHGQVSEKEFNEKIRGMKAAIRLNEIDGFADTLAKSCLMGQYPISKIPYSHIDAYGTEQELIDLINRLPSKKVPNTKVRDYWLPKLQTIL